MLDVCLLGTGGMMPLPNRWLTSLMARYNGKSILIDCGEGTQIAMKEKGWSPKPVDIMCFTHYHADHISGLPGMLLTMGNAERTEPLLMIGPKGLTRVVNALRVIAPELPFPIVYQEITEMEQTFSFEGFRIEAFRVNHNVTCYGYSILVERAGKFQLEKAQELPEIMEFAELSEQELDRIETLVQNLLKIARLDAGTVVLEKYEEHVADMMAHIERRFAYRAQKEGKRLELYGEDGIRLFCDRSWLLEAVGNLVKNALDHTREGDVIRIEWKQFASIVQIAVKDNGSGIHPEDLYHIFKRFYRSRFSQDTQGSGLGLPLAKAVVEAHGGTIEVDSQLGAGSSFLMNFLNPTEL